MTKQFKRIDKITIPPEIWKKIYKILWPAVERIYRQEQKMRVQEAEFNKKVNDNKLE